MKNGEFRNGGDNGSYEGNSFLPVAAGPIVPPIDPAAVATNTPAPSLNQTDGPAGLITFLRATLSIHRGNYQLNPPRISSQRGRTLLSAGESRNTSKSRYG
ncbi:UNVERIFIED_CONTAM: hypothetical protein Slati_1943300 [Sesamum latifolium]|uniref:Uncharacterized protein n=1 Tax=Sesamum latifolium TaxID=2727402 RepID=A0AAW2X4F9_9LAMI